MQMDRFEALAAKCYECGIDLEGFLNEKLLELEERKRVLLTPKQTWFSNNKAQFNVFAARLLGRPLTDTEKYDPRDGLSAQIERRFQPLARETLSSDAALKQSLLLEYNSRCATCGSPIDQSLVQIDHIVPLSEGGSNHSLNLQPLCYLCNNGKEDYFQDTVTAAARPWYEPRKRLVAGDVQLTPKKRFCALIRDGSSCRKCFKKATEVQLNVELRVPPSSGGQGVYDNLVSLCETCTSALR